MRFQILYSPTYSTLEVELEQGEEVEAEPGAMMMIEGDVEVKLKSRGILRKLAARESIFTVKYIAKEKSKVWFVSPFPGDIAYVPLEGKGLIISDKSYLAHHGDLKQKVVWRGLKGVFGGSGLMWLKVEGNGGVWLSSYGAIMEKEVKDEKLIIDNVHLLAMEDTLDYKVRKFGGIGTALFGGEGLVLEVRGHGKIYLQTRNQRSLLESLGIPKVR
ncbi:hypothetical protein IPA_01205 [Ignicoccus pacificus DSM 13166]|uniref:TIGR00266 family protein n=1 Tax=Ignicoccus pacificus DSM 13166 TaxID=940294 RepID=A0A977PJT1_9CREN|nr:hypothetical protein IPA_01205 [Ignicoccus pacificus DSM 13166]